jgi:hypothetical protein
LTSSSAPRRRRWTFRRRILPLCVAARVAIAPLPAAAESGFAARLSSAAAAIEYWDVTAWLESGHRFAARFLITNQGPGTRTAAAAGHLILPEHEVVPIMYGRTSEAWMLSTAGDRMKIASAMLDLSSQRFRVEVDSDKRGVKVALDFDGTGMPVSLQPVPGEYAIAVLLPTPARGSVWVRGMADMVAVQGMVALTHTWMERNEADLVTRRAELFAGAGDASVYVNDTTRANGSRGATLVLRRGGDFHRSDEAKVIFADTASETSDPGYLVPHGWEATYGQARARARLRHEWLRWDPLEILPQPFRFLLSLQAAPRRVWTDADVEITLPPSATAQPPLTVEGTGIATVSFARPGSFP